MDRSPEASDDPRADVSGEPDVPALVCEPNPKHKPIPSPGRHGSICPPGADGPALLHLSDAYRNKRYGVPNVTTKRGTPGMVIRSAGTRFPHLWSPTG